MEFREPTEHIELRQTQFGIKPVIAGRSVKVENIGVMYENESDIDWIAENLELTHAQVHAALAYFYDNREAFEEKIQEGIELSEQIGTPLSEFLNIKEKPLSAKENQGDSLVVVQDKGSFPPPVNYKSVTTGEAVPKISRIAS